MQIVLASESEFRKRALDLLGLTYVVCPSTIDEKAIRDVDPLALTRRLSEAKARGVARTFPEAVIVSGDAVVCLDGRIYEKPHDHAEARRFLAELSGQRFRFVTGLTVLRSDTGKMLSCAEASDITFRRLTEREIDQYVNRYDVAKYAGAFEAEGVLRFAERISGSYNFITALPMNRLIVFLRDQGVDI